MKRYILYIIEIFNKILSILINYYIYIIYRENLYLKSLFIINLL